MAHEIVYVIQYEELGEVGFAGKYAGEYLTGLITGEGADGAYRGIELEEEAYRRSYEICLDLVARGVLTPPPHQTREDFCEAETGYEAA
jgi:hypothetical protein